MLAAEAPKITDWMQAWGSLAGLVMSTAAVIFTGLLFRHEIRVRREEQRDKEASQARLVFGQVSGVSTDGAEDPGREPRRHETPATLQWLVTNRSSSPIMDVVFRVRAERSLVDWVDARHEELVTDSLSGELQVNPDLFYVKRGQFDPRTIHWEFEFTDAAGLRWVRERGSLPRRIVRPVGRVSAGQLTRAALSLRSTDVDGRRLRWLTWLVAHYFRRFGFGPLDLPRSRRPGNQPGDQRGPQTLPRDAA
ncbi:hypothetical protein [Micromonospora sp. CV4]|uniref:hypothetical protein n=1 Tax=Micromonospora sp. CV4 TaxID=2478711 RepID=UPI0011C46095|nr:hypothetical protein [Micromonospora sp. CV4]